MDETLFKKIAEEVEKEWQESGLSEGLYYDFAKEVTERYITIHSNRAYRSEITIEADISNAGTVHVGKSE